jgi:hypothetical protein
MEHEHRLMTISGSDALHVLLRRTCAYDIVIVRREGKGEEVKRGKRTTRGRDDEGRRERKTMVEERVARSTSEW